MTTALETVGSSAKKRRRNLSRRFRFLQPPDGWAEDQGCWILGCGRKLGPAYGMCWGHLQRVYRRQAVLVILKSDPGKKIQRVAYFGPRRPDHREHRLVLIKYELSTNWTPEPNTGCWLWLGPVHPDTGYALVGNSEDPWGGYGHRAVVHFRGEVLERRNRFRHVRHTCGQPACVNPDHLVYGTAKENMEDRERDKRMGLRPLPFFPNRRRKAA